MAEFASKGGAYGVGIPALALGGLAFLQNGGLGGLGGLFGGGNAAMLAGGTALGVLSEKDAKIAKLEAERYTDNQILDTRDRIAALNEKVIGYVIDLDKRVSVNEADFRCLSQQVQRHDTVLTTLSQEAAASREREVALRKDIECLANGTNAALKSLGDTVGQITKLIIPASMVCPQPMPAQNAWVAPNNCGCSCNNG